MVVHAVPRPRSRAASMKLHTAGSSEPHADAAWKVGARFRSPMMHGTMITGTRWKFSVRYVADSVILSFCS
jgi:hypothetical protein